MASQAQMLLHTNHRRHDRVPLSGAITYAYEAGESGKASCCDVSDGGMRVLLGRYLRPGRRLMVQLPQDAGSANTRELKAEIAWCSPTAAPHEFLAGLRVLHDAPDAPATLAALAAQGTLPLKKRKPRGEPVAIPLIVQAWADKFDAPASPEKWTGFRVMVCAGLAKTMAIAVLAAVMALPKA